jgi:hypothetical protein
MVKSYYIATNDPARGFQGHGKLAFFYTNGQYKELYKRENSEMITLISVQQDDLLSGDKEIAELAQEACISFGGSMEFVGTTSAEEDRTCKEMEQIRLCLEAQTSSHRKKGTTNQSTWSERCGGSSSYYGLEDPQENC